MGWQSIARSRLGQPLCKPSSETLKVAAECRTEGCTVADTGICLLANDPDTCEFRAVEAEPESVEADEFTAPVIEAPSEKPTLWGSLPLDFDELRDLMAQRKCHVVGILGSPAAGKTAALVSLYLLLSHNNLTGFQFADSRTLLAFEEISQGARRWEEAPPDEMTARTETSGGRVAGFLHIRVKRLADGQLLDFLVPDLPGEWSEVLIDTNRTDRFEFIRSADVIWMFINGADLRDNARRMYTLNRTKLLIQRVTTMLGARIPPVKLIVSHADHGELTAATTAKLQEFAEDAGVNAEIVSIASFSNDDAVAAAGAGLSSLIDASIPRELPRPLDWPTRSQQADRFMLRYTEAEKS